MPASQRFDYAPFVENQAMIEENWDKEFGDRKNELVFIGIHIDEEVIRPKLNECLMTDERT